MLPNDLVLFCAASRPIFSATVLFITMDFNSAVQPLGIWREPKTMFMLMLKLIR